MILIVLGNDPYRFRKRSLSFWEMILIVSGNHPYRFEKTCWCSHHFIFYKLFFLVIATRPPAWCSRAGSPGKLFFTFITADSSLHFVPFGMTTEWYDRIRGISKGGCAAFADSPIRLGRAVIPNEERNLFNKKTCELVWGKMNLITFTVNFIEKSRNAIWQFLIPLISLFRGFPDAGILYNGLMAVGFNPENRNLPQETDYMHPNFKICLYYMIGGKKYNAWIFVKN